LNKYDFSTAIVRLVASVNGRHTGVNFNRFGQNRLGKLFGSKAKVGEKLVTYQTSSLGRLNTKFLNEFLS
jgi:hypothetical protein